MKKRPFLLAAIVVLLMLVALATGGLIPSCVATTEKSGEMATEDRQGDAPEEGTSVNDTMEAPAAASRGQMSDDDDSWGAPPDRSPASTSPTPGVDESPDQVEELPEQTVLNSVCLLNNTNTGPILVQAELSPVRPAPKELGYLAKSVVDIPKEIPGPVVFSIWLKKDRAVRVRCPLNRGSSYQVFLHKQTKKLAVAPMPSN